MQHYAHTLPPPATREDWEPLHDHLRWVAEGDRGAKLAGAATFADAFGAAEWGRLLGWWHDLGKYSEAFQDFLDASNDLHVDDVKGKVDHSTAGAKHAAAQGPFGRLLAYAIAGHHAGLPDAQGGEASLDKRLRKVVEPWQHAADPAVLKLPVPNALPLGLDGSRSRLAFSVALFTRMLFSCLVDADFLATEAFMSRDLAKLRPTLTPLSNLLDSLNTYLDRVAQEADDTTVNRQRAKVLAACREKATLPPGLFSLNVPTGGGKTLSSLAFALEHAKANDLRRVIYAIPFTSIVEQTADVFRREAGLSEVLEVHSNLDRANDIAGLRTRLAAENFDAPLIVTTNVQLLESLYAARTSKCRKLHRLAGSVIIFDEAQTLPPNLLKPTLWALDELAKHYRCTIVLCTATQPAIERREGFDIGLTGLTQIIDGSAGLHAALKRVEVKHVGAIDDDALVAELSRRRQALCIVNTRRHARDLAARVDHAIHLSANQCAAHRSVIVEKIRTRLHEKKRCRVISTAVIEAGVDVDSPRVYRATAGLDSIAQAAGRCNREGNFEVGRAYVFDAVDGGKPPPFVREAADAAQQVMSDHTDLLSPAAIEHYFRLFYWSKGGDGGKGWDVGSDGEPVCGCFDVVEGPNFQFRLAAERYRLIDDVQTPVVVPWGRGRRLIKQLQRMNEQVDATRLRRWDRQAQRYVVGLFDHELRRMLDACSVIPHLGRYYVDNEEAYDRRLGLLSNVETLSIAPQVGL